MKGCANICRSAKGGSNDGIFDAVVSGWGAGRWAADLAAPAAKTQDDTAAIRLADVLREAHAELDQASPPALSAAVRGARPAGAAARAGVRASLRSPQCTAGQSHQSSHRARYRQLDEHARRQSTGTGEAASQIRRR